APLPAQTLPALCLRIATGRGTRADGLHGVPASGRDDRATAGRGGGGGSCAGSVRCCAPVLAARDLAARGAAAHEVTRTTSRQSARGSGRGRRCTVRAGPCPVRDREGRRPAWARVLGAGAGTPPVAPCDDRLTVKRPVPALWRCRTAVCDRRFTG